MYEASPPATTPHTLSSFTTAFPRTTPHKANSHARTEIPQSRTRHGEAPHPLHERRHRPPGPPSVERTASPEVRQAADGAFPPRHPAPPASARTTTARNPTHTAEPGSDALRARHRRSGISRPPPAWETGSRRAGPDTGVRAPHSCCRLGAGGGAIASASHRSAQGRLHDGTHEPRPASAAPTATRTRSSAFPGLQTPGESRVAGSLFPRPKSPAVPQHTITGCPPSPGPAAVPVVTVTSVASVRIDAVPAPATPAPYRRGGPDQRRSAARRRCPRLRDGRRRAECRRGR
ncbi:hypothetical protein M2168_002011 [Streptomyces sp. CZ24]|nr:hypothetical protein [Streptomyces sp. CZ24]